MSDEYQYYTSTQFLGKHGVTLKCMQAMVAILAGPYHPEKITMVIGSFDASGSKRVMFLVWEWGYPGITIVSDGFGTHGGEGGAGLATVLGLIKYYQIPLLEVWIQDQKSFDELAHGTLTEDMFDEVQEGQQPYNWKFYAPAKIQKVQKGEQQTLIAVRGDGHVIFNVNLP